MMRKTIIRPFQGSQAEAEGLLAVEKATFAESPYSAAEIRTMLTDGPQRAWLALAGEQVVGFVTAFVTYRRRKSPCWEIDLLAVHPDWQGQGLARRLIRAAAAHGATVAYRARALVADDNGASARAFLRVGFRRSEEAYRLLIFRTDKQPLPPPQAPGVRIRAEEEPQQGRTMLYAAKGERPTGEVELLQVETLLYRGLWLESWQAEIPETAAALVRAALERAAVAGLEEVGAVIPEENRLWQETLLTAGFRSLGRFHWLTARLPLPGAVIGPWDVLRP